MRLEILEAAREVFEELGYEGASIREVARRSGVGTGTVFNYVEDKRELLMEALREDLDEVVSACLASMPGAEVGVEALVEHTLGMFLAYYAQRPALSRALLRESLFAQGEAGARFRAQVEGVAAALVERVSAMRSLGLVRQDIDPRWVILAILSHYYFALISGLTQGLDAPAMMGQIRGLVRQLHVGIGPDLEDT